MRQGFKRRPIDPQAQAQSATRKFPAPVRGWVANENVAESGPNGASVLLNFFPTSTGIRIRRGSQPAATLPNGEVISLFTYVGSTSRLFASDTANIYDVTTGVLQVVGSQMGGYYVSTQFDTAGADYMVAVNGVDPMLLYTGATNAWSQIASGTTPISITGVDTRHFSHVWTYRGRLFFIEKGTRNAWCLPVGNLGGAAIPIPLTGILQLGGSLLFGSTWSFDAGDGPNEYCVFVSTEGEAVVFQGGDPTSASGWSIVGRYFITKPLGQRATMRSGADLLIATEIGLVPISQAVAKDTAGLALASVSRPIEPVWQLEAMNRRSAQWELLKWAGQKMAVVGMPMAGETKPYCLVMNLETGAWTKYIGWDVGCMTTFGPNAYFGTRDGRIMQMEVGPDDAGNAYYCDYTGLYDDMGAPTSLKVAKLARATFRASVPVVSTCSAAFNYGDVKPTFPQALVNNAPAGQWDSARWDQAVWDSGGVKQISSRWQGIFGNGSVIAPAIRVLVSGGQAPDGELISTEYIYETGAPVV